jgi:uncharacterized glyoxalase superfamily protein PhnB
MSVHELFPYLCVRDSSAAVAFYQRAFGATELFRLVEPSGRVGHAEISIGGHVVMLCDAFPEYGTRAPEDGEKLTFVLHLHVDDADARMAQAVAAGATIVRPAADQFYGERNGRVRDPFGYEWLIGHSIEKLSHAEMQQRYTALFAAEKP